MDKREYRLIEYSSKGRAKKNGRCTGTVPARNEQIDVEKDIKTDGKTRVGPNEYINFVKCRVKCGGRNRQDKVEERTSEAASRIQ